MAEAPLIGRMDFYHAMVRSNTFTRSALAVAFVLLYRCQNGRTGRCNPSIARLAEETGLAERSVKRALGELRESRWWRIRRGGEKGPGDTNNYAPQLEKGDMGVTHSDPERVTWASPIRGLEKGDKVGTKRVTPVSPKPVKNQEKTLSRSISSTPRVSRNGSEDDPFETFWRTYPSRGEHANPKAPARKKFAAATKSGADPADIVRAARGYRARIRATGTDPRFVAQAVTWLSQERWTDPAVAPAEPPWPVAGMI
jgi:hypothetical protein